MSYVRAKTRGWRPQFNGLRGLGQVRKLVVSGLGCACKKGLGQDDVDDFPSFTPTGPSYAFGPTDSYTDNPVNVPAGYGYGPSQSGGVAVYPAGPVQTPITASASPSSGIVSVASSGLTQSVLVGAGVGVSAPSLGVSNSWLWIGGAAFLALLLIETSGKGRR
jgi:hypothetical protein